MREFLTSLSVSGGQVIGGLFAPLQSTDFPLSGVTAGQYSLANVTVDQHGRVTAIATGSLSAMEFSGNNGTTDGTGTPVTGRVGDKNRVLFARPDGQLCTAVDSPTFGQSPAFYVEYMGDFFQRDGIGVVIGSQYIGGSFVFSKGNDSEQFIIFTGESNLGFGGVGMWQGSWASPLDLTLCEVRCGPVYIGDNNQVGAMLTITTGTAQTTDLLQAQSNTGTVLWCVDKNGHAIIRKNAAPADGDLEANELAYWFDSTNGASKVKFKGKSANGTVVTGEVALS